LQHSMKPGVIIRKGKTTLTISKLKDGRLTWKKRINKIHMVLGSQLVVEVERWEVIETEIRIWGEEVAHQVDTDPVGEDLMNGTRAVREVLMTMLEEGGIMTLLEEGGIMSGEPFMAEQGTKKDMGT